MSKEIATHLMERIRLPVEKVLWQTALKNIKGIDGKIEENGRVLLIGTDPGLTLAREVLITFPKAQITVVERDGNVLEKAKMNLSQYPLKENITLVEGDFLELEESMPRVTLVIAKHLIHFPGVNVEEVVMRALCVGEIFLASVPPMMGKIKTDKDLKRLKLEVKIRKKPLGFLHLQGDLYVIEKRGQDEGDKVYV